MCKQFTVPLKSVYRALTSLRFLVWYNASFKHARELRVMVEIVVLYDLESDSHLCIY